MERFMEGFNQAGSEPRGEGRNGRMPIHAHRAPDLPVPVDEPAPDPQPNHPHHPDAPVEQDDPVPDHKPE